MIADRGGYSYVTAWQGLRVWTMPDGQRYGSIVQTLVSIARQRDKATGFRGRQLVKHRKAARRAAKRAA